MRWLSILLLVFVSVGEAPAAVTGLATIPQDLGSSPAGYITHDVLIDFTGRLFGQQMVVELDSGSIYQDELGNETAPNPALYSLFPFLEADSFVALGGSNRDDSFPVIVIGGTTELGLNGPKRFDLEAINVAWAPAPGTEVDDRQRFLTARITLSNDASGRLHYFGNADAIPTTFEPIPFRDGFFPLDLHVPVYPEPSSVALFAVAISASTLGRPRR